jgi:hypothetical protein
MIQRDIYEEGERASKVPSFRKEGEVGVIQCGVGICKYDVMDDDLCEIEGWEMLHIHVFSLPAHYSHLKRRQSQNQSQNEKKVQLRKDLPC